MVRNASTYSQFLIGTAASVFCAAALAAPRYNIEPITLPVSGKPVVGAALAINDLGQTAVRGTAQDFNVPGQVISIGAPAGAAMVTVHDLNSNGVVVGRADNGAFSWQGGSSRSWPICQARSRVRPTRSTSMAWW